MLSQVRGVIADALDIVIDLEHGDDEPEARCLSNQGIWFGFIHE
jgi:hypothetical protein